MQVCSSYWTENPLHTWLSHTASPLYPSLFLKSTQTHTTHTHTLWLEVWFQYCKVSQVHRDTQSEDLQGFDCSWRPRRLVLLNVPRQNVSDVLRCFLCICSIWHKTTPRRTDYHTASPSPLCEPHTRIKLGKTDTCCMYSTSSQCPSQPSQTPSLIPVRSLDMLDTLIKASLSAWHAYMQRAQKASFVP